MNRWIVAILSILSVATFEGCANIPRQSAELSAALNNQISDMQKVHLALMNRYFDEVEGRMRQTLMGDYKDALVQTMKDKQREKGKELTVEQYDKIIARVLARQDQVLADLQKMRSDASSAIMDRYVLMRSEGQSLQQLLESASKLQEARQKYTGQVEAKVDSGLNFLEKVDAKVQGYVDEANRVREVVNKIKDEVKGDVEEVIHGQPR